MNNQDNHKFYEDLILKYLSSNADAAEVEQLENWVLSDPANKKHFTKTKKAWMLMSVKEEAGIDANEIDEMWKKTSEQLGFEGKVIDLKADRETVQESSFGRRKWMSIAAAMTIFLIGSFLWFQFSGESGPLIVESGDLPETVELADGSKVILNPHSSLNFIINRETKKRELVLEGNAFFDVQREETLPFEIKSGDVVVEVLGTSFYIDSRVKEKEWQVIVESGKVAVRYGQSEEILIAGEKATYDRNKKKLSKLKNQDKNFLSIKTQKLVFENERLDKVVFDLNRHFGQTIKIANKALEECKFNSTFNNKSLKSILTILENSFSLRMSQTKSGEYILQGTCK